MAIVGESGCGKSTFARILMGLTQATGGSIELKGLELSRLTVTRRARETIRSLQMIFQNPFDTLNPARTVGAQIARVIRKLGVQRAERAIRERMFELLDLVKLPRDIALRHCANCREGRNSASAWRAPSPAIPPWSWRTNRCRRSTCRCRLL